ncbi:UDP-N-acetylmuramoyl-tripeptide--D-alanyl-D-alanine ligase [Caulobacter mirabilis]|uniref:UDP-N-acetylmuramoyl-tripeptide--D-alanyl-D-alanine ligase n=1 Tax=Caulobacter mirabilis TaxID=69666 RepID=A0A2D2B0N1_9CAUL|nr:UDP-N-acetylmuramoyl-tripeptide--D-alanyl-D-alanine ligase [Caulobacter mirabilis]ATQ43804.1 UDP-N-acetylmuramoylalanyl-D-glutamyl-2, 6-diaminopimelate--D-alanyl-D-alanine ligase [Caulobacter mirabilis]
MAEPLWTSDEIGAATGGRVVAGPFAVSGVSIDSRSVEPGDLFVALAGARDGHEFAAGALASGAAAVLARKPVQGPHVLVEDTLGALEKLGVAARDRSPARRAAITGSVGKTSVTQAVAAGLALAGRWHSSVKSYNNHIGVPLTLARMPRDTERAVFEIGMNHADEIGPLSRFVQPDVVAITTVGPVHIENFPNGERGVALAKAEIFQGLKPGGVAVLNADNVWFDLLREEAGKVGARVRSFGTGEDADARLLAFEPADGRVRVRALVDGETLSFPLRQTGLHWGLNSLCVLLTLEAMDVSRDTALAALEGFAPLAGRGAEKTVAIPGGVFTLIDESYNANPISMEAAFRTLGARAAPGRRIVALTDMLELGEQAPSFHAGLAAPIEAADVDLVFAAGPMMKSLWDALPPTRRGGYAETAAQLAPLVASAVEPGDLVMVKGSNGSRAGVIAAALAALDHAGDKA